MSTLSEVRLDFIKLSKRYDLLDSGDISANVDDGANAFLNAGLRYLDSKLRHKKSVKRFVKVLAIGDYTFTVPDFITLEQFLMITATEEIDLTSEERSMRDFRRKFQRPYSGWTNGVPAAWAINSDILVDEMESSVPQDALGQGDVRRVPSEGEILVNPSFGDVFYTPENATATGTALREDTPFWERTSETKVVFNHTNKSMDIDGAYTALDLIFRQDIDNMRFRPDIVVLYRASMTVSNYVSGEVRIQLGDGTTASLTANGTLTSDIQPNSYSVEPYFSIVSATTDTVDLEITEVSLVEIGLINLTTNVSPVSTENRTGIIFNPPTDVARTAEFYARFFTPAMTRDTDRNYWTDSYPILLAMAGAYILEKGNQSRSRMKYWLEAMEPEIFDIDADVIEDEMNAMENSHERTR